MIRKIRRIHFVGVGGIGMCGLAELLHDQGYGVTGSDLRAGATTERLSGLGIHVSIGHEAGHVGDADVVVYSSAVSPRNPEIEEAGRREIPVIPRAEMLAEMMRLKDGIAVAGTHGKTTTTSLVAHILGEAGLDPTAIIGGRVLAPERDATGARLGTGEVLVAEADESDGSFLRLAPVSVVVTNIDADHLDHYGSFEALEQAFVDFVNRIPFWGVAVLCLDHPGVQNILPRLTRRLFTYGFTHQADLVAEEVVANEQGMRFVVRLRGELLGPVEIALPGRHNVANALAAIAVALELEVPWTRAAAAVASFAGVERRFEHKGSAAGVRVVDDYGHHPAEVRATLAAAREAHRGRIVTVFQPHRYTRTRDCFEEFATAFNDADLLLVTEVYAAGEEAIPGASGELLAEAIRAHGHRNVRFVPGLDELAGDLPGELQKGDLVLTLGAGDVCTLGPRLLEALGAGRGAL
ncbi:MAG: UDP-N-acetylmuramate--L-alanine ligase [Deltaproteobacteria bacterium]|nr:UDP-N-acetylmuramate--L-alanine ligase [Deltaproteobacteria bacterium]MBW2417045.1 UDP-N-acetylmuramate--L-alanine ligase [Deltaproteobacteria bacterium]